MDYQALGQRIKQHRKWLMLTQEQVASAAELSTSFYGHIERGTRVASIATLLSISCTLGTTPDALLETDVAYSASMPPAVLECVDSVRSLMDQIEAYYGTKDSRKRKTRARTGERD
ncbi:MAG: helix-turn-helix domain-containing protein [Clostridia bacterium]|nr:helix-turn-helix domain-containing protein [Clostridia bacterium]